MAVSEVKARVSADGIEQFKAAMRQAGSAIQGVGSAAQTHMGALDGLNSALARIGTAGLAVGAGVIAGGAAALRTAADYERLTATFQALSGSSDQARAKMAWVKDFAKTSTLEFGDIAEAGTQIEASGLRMETVIPVMSKLAAAFGGGRDEVMELASAFGRLPSGQFGESMEIFRRFGISAQGLMQRGIRFDGGGQIRSSAGEVMDAVVAIVESKFGRINDLMANTMNVRLSNLKDSFNQMLGSIGEGLLPIAGRVVAVFSGVIEWVKSSGFFEAVGGSFAKLLGLSTNWVVDLQDKILRVLTVFRRFAEILGGIGERVGGLWNVFVRVAPVLAAINMVVRGFAAMAAVMATIQTMAKQWKLTVAAVAVGAATYMGVDWLLKEAAKPDASAVAAERDLVSRLAPAAPKAPAVTGYFQDPLSALAGPDAMKAMMGGATAPIPKPPAVRDQQDTLNTIATATSATAANTAKLADQRRYVVGGGPRARIGVTPVELNSYQTGAGRTVVRVEAGGRALNAALEELFAAFLLSARRQGLA